MRKKEKVEETHIDFKAHAKKQKKLEPIVALENDLNEWLMTEEIGSNGLYMFSDQKETTASVQNEYSISSEEREIYQKKMMDDHIAEMLKEEDVDPFTPEQDNLVQELDDLLDLEEEKEDA